MKSLLFLFVLVLAGFAAGKCFFWAYHRFSSKPAAVAQASLPVPASVTVSPSPSSAVLDQAKRLTVTGVCVRRPYAFVWLSDGRLLRESDPELGRIEPGRVLIEKRWVPIRPPFVDLPGASSSAPTGFAAFLAQAKGSGQTSAAKP